MFTGNLFVAVTVWYYTLPKKTTTSELVISSWLDKWNTCLSGPCVSPHYVDMRDVSISGSTARHPWNPRMQMMPRRNAAIGRTGWGNRPATGITFQVEQGQTFRSRQHSSVLPIWWVGHRKTHGRCVTGGRHSICRGFPPEWRTLSEAEKHQNIGSKLDLLQRKVVYYYHIGLLNDI